MISIFSKIKKVIKEEERARFRIATAFKFAIIPILSILFLLVLGYIILSVTLSVLNSHLAEISFIVPDLVNSFVSQTIINISPWIGVMFVILFCIGLMVGSLMLRPFKNIATYCEERLVDESSTYDPSFTTDLMLLNSFSEWFFHTVETNSSKNIAIPNKYKGIHKPVFEKNFFIYNFLIVIFVTIISAVTIHYLSLEIYEDLVDVVKEVYSKSKEVTGFTQSLYRIFFNVSNLAIAFNISLYLFFLFHIYSKVSTPAFGIFATMRSFISGKRHARVHLIGYTYIRSYTRSINKYLDSLTQTKD